MRYFTRRSRACLTSASTPTKGRYVEVGAILVGLAVVVLCRPSGRLEAQVTAPIMLHPNLAVRTVVSGLTTPSTIAFLGANDILVLEKNTGRVRRVVNGVIQSTVLDLAVNFFSERGLLGIAMHPNFLEHPWVYLYWTESNTGADTDVPANTPLLGNRVDRFVWNGSTLAFDRNLISIRAIQEDAGQPQRGNHDGGVLAFERDDDDDSQERRGDGRREDENDDEDDEDEDRAKLFILIGDLGRRGWMQNLPCGPTPNCPGPSMQDDQFGGPEPDDAHLSGVILRLNDDGSIPEDNPFFEVGKGIAGEAGVNIQKVFAYGLRNSFGMAFDSISENLWIQENSDDAFSEINRVEPGMNGGWIQIMGPVARIAQFKEIELTLPPSGGVPGAQLQQIRWPPTLIADTPQQALERLFMLPGSEYSDPEFSWKFEVAPGGIGFVNSRALGRQFEGDLFVGAATPLLAGGYLFRFKLTGNRRSIAVDDPRLEDRVADNLAKHEITESESLLIGRDFGVGTDVETGPNGNVFVVSLSHGAIYEIHR
jgi:aldose sugar dehydrogenase